MRVVCYDFGINKRPCSTGGPRSCISGVGLKADVTDVTVTFVRMVPSARLLDATAMYMGYSGLL